MTRPADKYAKYKGLRRQRPSGAQRYRGRLNDSPTAAEALFAKALSERQIKFVQNFTVRTAESFTGVYHVDFALPQHHLFIELDGKPHTSERAQWNDRLRTEAILRAHPGWRLVRFWNHELDDMDDVFSRLELSP